MKIAVIGCGRVGSTLGQAWSKMGHTIFYGVRNKESRRVKKLSEQKTVNSVLLPIHEAIECSDIVLYAAPYEAASEALFGIDFGGRVLIDATNPFKFTLKGLEGLQLGFDSSAAEEIQKIADSARVVKAFNTVSSVMMKDPVINGAKADVYICGDDPKAVSLVGNLAAELNFNPLLAGELINARNIEPMALMWTKMAMSGMGSEFLSKLIKREAE